MISWVWSFMIFRREVNMLSGMICKTFSEREKRKNSWPSLLFFLADKCQDGRKTVPVCTRSHLSTGRDGRGLNKSCFNICSQAHGYVPSNMNCSQDIKLTLIHMQQKDVSFPHYKLSRDCGSEVLVIWLRGTQLVWDARDFEPRSAGLHAVPEVTATRTKILLETLGSN